MNERNPFASEPALKIAFAKILDNAALSEKRHEPVFSGFFDPLSAGKFAHALSFAEGSRLVVKTFGGATGCERQMLGVSPADFELADFPIATVAVTYPAKFGKELQHKDYLGALMGLSFVREKIGDILLFEREGSRGAYIFTTKFVAPLVTASLEKVGPQRVYAEICPPELVLEAAPDKTLSRVNTASLRLDAVIAEVFHVPRAKAAALIAGEKVFVNWQSQTKGAKTLTEGDIVTVRGFGRFETGRVAGQTKKDRLVLEVFRYSEPKN